jgi:hypothetical protein
MTIIRKYNFNLTEVSAIATDTYNGNFLWIAFKQNDEGNCLLRKVSANDLNQVYFTVTIATNKIKKLYVYSTSIYLLLDDTTLFAKILSLSNPLATGTNISILGGITENAIDCLIDESYLYFLIPGNLSGTNTKILKYSTAGVYNSTIDLATVQNAKSFTIDTSNEFWVVTYDSPSSLIRVYYDGGWNYTIF